MFNEISVMNTQKLRRLLVCVGLALLGAAMVSAQPSGEGKGLGQGFGREGKEGGPGDRMRQLAQHLELTPAQVEQMRPIMRANMEAMRALREDAALEGKARREKGQALRDENRAAIRAILTPEQQAKFDALPQRGPGGPQDKKQVN